MSDWDAIIKDEDRKLENADRRYRRHNNSLEAMSEEFTYQQSLYRESMARFVADELATSRDAFDFTTGIQNEKLAAAIRKLTEKQRRVIELTYWEGMKQKEIAEKMGCTPAAVSKLLSKALGTIAKLLSYR